MKPFLLLSTRPEDAAAAGERSAILRFGGLAPDDLEQVRVEEAPLGVVDLTGYSGIFLGGGPFNSSDALKTELQHRVESDIHEVLDDALGRDFPFLGLCYGIGTVTTHLGGVVDRRFGEPVGAVDIRLTAQGRHDPLLENLPDEFRAFVGHKEAVAKLPKDATLLATSSAAPVQMYRVQNNCYVTQFHPELDAPGIAERIHVYKENGYFHPSETEDLVRATAEAAITPEVHGIIARFVERYAS